MKLKGKNKHGFDIYEIEEKEIIKMFEESEKQMQFTFPEKNSGYAASVLTKDGNIYSGASYKSDTHNLTMHGEAATFAIAANNGETSIVAITGPNCHNCKQLVWESSVRSKIDTIVLIEENGKYLQIPISELMPYPWPDHNLNY